MALLSPTEYKKMMGQSVTQPAVPSTFKTVSSGLISPSEFKASLAAQAKAEQDQKQAASFIQAEQKYGAPNLNPSFSQVSLPAPEPKQPTLLQKVGQGVKQVAGKAFDYGLAKPASSLTAVAADVGGKLNNLFEKKGIGYNGEKIQPSQTRSIGEDLAAIWKNPGSGADVAHQAMIGAVPNDYLQNRALPGTNLTLGSIEEGLLQSATPIPGVGLIKKGVTAAKDVNKARNLSKAAKDFIGRTKEVTPADTAATMTNAAKSGLVQELPVSAKPAQEPSGLISPDDYKKSLASSPPPEPTILDDLVKSKGHTEVTPETVAQTYNNKDWYHGTGKADLAGHQLDPNITNHESLFGQGVYMTDNPDIAQGYANSKGKRSGTPTVYKANVNVNRVLDIEKPITDDVKAAIEKSVKPLDYAYQREFDEPNYFTDTIQKEMAKEGATPETVITALRNEVSDFSHEAQLPTSEFAEDFQDLASNLKEAGYDALTHTGGLRTGKEPHRVMIMLDPQNWSGATAGQGSQITNFEKHINKPKEEFLNEDVAPEPQPIKLTPAEQAKQKQIDEFSKVEDNPNIPDTSVQIQSKTVKEAIPLAQRANEAYIKGVDNLHRLNQFDQMVSEVVGPVPEGTSAYKLALNSRGSDVITRQILDRNLVDSQGNIIGDSLKSVADQIPNNKLDDFEDYLVAKHAITRMGRGEKVYKDDLEMTIQKAEAIVNRYESSEPEFKTAAAAYYEYNKKLGQAWLVDTGVISQKQWDGYLTHNPYYVPNNRIFTALEKQRQYGSKRGYGNQSNPVKKAPGSQRPIVSPIESTIENTAKYVNVAKKNEVAQVLYMNMARDPEAMSAWGDIVHADSKLADDPSVVKLLEGEDGIESLLDNMEKEFEQKVDLTKGNIISVLFNGERKYMRINDPQLLEALTNISPRGQDYVTKVVGKLTHTMTTLTTGINPLFGITRNIVKDIPHAYIASKSTVNPVRFGVDILDAVTSVLADSISHSKAIPKFLKSWLETRGKLYNSYKNLGGGHASPTAADRNLLAQSKERILPARGIKQKLKLPFTKALHAIENLNNAVEAAPRLGEFKRFSKPGTYDSKVKALYESNDVTTNFKKYGNVTKNVNAYIPYINAATQGLDQLVRMGTKGGAKRLAQVYAKAIGTLTIPTVILYLINHDNPDYQKVSNYIKDNNMLIPKGDGTFIKIAKPRELGMIFSTAVERGLKAFADNDPQAFEDFTYDFLQSVSPPGISGAIQGVYEGGATGALTGVLGDTILGPISSLASNKDFSNRSIVPGDLQRLSPKYQYDSQTSEVSKFLGDKLNASPKQLDFLLRSYGGVLGQIGIPATTPGTTVGETLKRQVTADPLYSNDIARNFYDAKDQADKAAADQDQTGIPQPNAKYQLYYDRVSRSISKLRSQAKAIQANKNLPAKDKLNQLRAIQKQINDIEQRSTITAP